MKRRILSLLLVLTLLMALPVAAAADETKKVTLTLTQDTWTYTDTVTFSVKGPGGEDVPNGEVVVHHDVNKVSRCVNNGVAEISASELVSGLGLTLDQETEIIVNYAPGSGSNYEPTSDQTLSITVNKGVLTRVEMTGYTGYEYGKPASDFRISNVSEGASVLVTQFRDAEEAELTGNFEEKAYALWVRLGATGNYTLPNNPENLAVTLNGQSANVKDGWFVFQLEPLVRSFTVTFDTAYGTAPNPQTVQRGGNATEPKLPDEGDHAFKGWYTDRECITPFDFAQTQINNDITLYAKWVNRYTVFYKNGGHGQSTMPANEKVEEGKCATRPTDPTEKGWIFKGWYENDDYIGDVFDFEKTQITHDITLTARWAQAFTVKFDTNGHGHGTVPADQTVEINGKAAKPTDPTDGAYSFQGWYTTAECSTTFDFSTPITGNTTVYAKWVKKPIVSFNTNGHGTAPASQTVELNGKAVKPADPTAEGYVFRGWYTTAACTTEFDFNTPIAADTTLYAKWDEIYTVTFNVGGHGTAPAAQKVENGGKATKPENPTAKGWRFDGWYTDEKCTARYDFDKAVTANTTLYAKWTQLFTLTFETNGGTKIDSVEAPDGSLVYLGSYKPTKSGYYFVGWYTDKNLTRASRVGYVRMDGNKTVYAKFAVADKTNPKTADPALPGLAMAVLSFSAVGLAAMGLKKRK